VPVFKTGEFLTADFADFLEEREGLKKLKVRMGSDLGVWKNVLTGGKRL